MIPAFTGASRAVLRNLWNLSNRLFSSAVNCSESNGGTLWEPEYLARAKSKFPEYEAVNVQIKGYDYSILESFQAKIHWFAKEMNLEVSNCWAQEFQKFKVTLLKPHSSVEVADYVLKVFERNVQIVGAFGHQMPLFLELIATACPAGVNVEVHKNESKHEENRYVPEYDIIDLKEQLEELKKS